MKIKKNDSVLITTGKDKGKKGKVVRVFPKEGKVVIEGLNLVKKHTRPRQQGAKGQRVETPAPLATSKVMLVCVNCGKSTRIGYKFNGENKIRFCKKCGKEI